MNKRIIGIDVARALAVIGMIIVNFKMVFGSEGSNWVKNFASIFEGKAAATFVVLAGVGLALTTKKAIQTNNIEKLKTAKKRITKRALLLFLIGISYIAIWPADILHFYGVYIFIVLLLLKSSGRFILLSGTILILGYPLLMIIWNYETGWNFDTFNYQNFWTVKGFVRNLFYNGFHPVLPWTAFMIFGYWFGKQDLQNANYVKRLFVYSIITFISIQLISLLLISLLSDGTEQMTKELTEVLGTSPMPPLPIYMFNGIAIAFTIISACILIGEKYENNKIISALNKTGQLALTFYVAHVVLGMGIVDAINPGKLGLLSVEFSVGYAIVFSLLCILFAIIWLKYKKSGPLEWVFRKLTN
ncbi:DUF418 domain-containing protein [Tenacibaculum caenipelagi]|uniref:Putative membrane protein YeiB n=1 Tax=Tenacibaculum caenipelagi TaxID=1325435 RepID=A0A4R6TDV3_9FLAO|nr:DUF418 domain-containing protein [Tenacibaculum caenipelagi]TDQ24011.1 putative membrane protein YeiB [Tenacibaculum caenipelagi]